jgi:hypothetical protein
MQNTATNLCQEGWSNVETPGVRLGFAASQQQQ